MKKFKLTPFLILVIILIPIITSALPVFSKSAAGSTPDEQSVIDTGLPVMYINTEDGQPITDRETWLGGDLRIRNTEAYSACENIYTLTGAGLRLKGRGNSTWWQFQTQKRCYSLKLDHKVSLFGMDASKKWILLANFMDRSNLRNYFAYNLSGMLGLEFCESVFVNLYLNNSYMGVYQLCERPSAPITDWEALAEDLAENISRKNGLSAEETSELEVLCKNDLNWMTENTYHGYTVSDYIDLSDYSPKGGYLIEYDYYYDEPSRFKTKSGVPLNIRTPAALSSNNRLFKSLQSYFNEFEEALYSDTFTNSKGKHYSSYLDMDSLVDYYIVNALLKNVEFGYKSMYLYLDEDRIIHFGPCWDYDWSSGNHFLGAAPAPDQWYDDWRATTNVWYTRLYSDPYFVLRVQERWFEVLPLIEQTISELEEMKALLEPAADLERMYYLSLDSEKDYRQQSGGYEFADEADALSDFLIERYQWMTEQFSKKSPNIEGAGQKLDASIELKLTDPTGDWLTESPDDCLPAADYAVLDADSDFQSDFYLTCNQNAQFYINGIYIGSGGEITVSSSTLRAGCNILLAVCGDQVNFITLRLPKSAPEFVDITRSTVWQPSPAAIIYLPQSSEAAETEAIRSAALLSAAFLLGGGILSSAFIILFSRKRSK